MSQNKTIIPGVDYNQLQETEENGFYSRSASGSNQNKTYIPDIYRQMSQELDDEAQQKSNVRNIELQDRTIAGVLFSISHVSLGEMFPVYIGRNTIGSDINSDIFLPEETVSPNHAVLLVRRTESYDGDGKITVSLTDYDSKYGTMIGETQLEYEKLKVEDHDIISVGCSYRFLFCLFDKDKHNLYLDPNFKALKKEEMFNEYDNKQIQQEYNANEASESFQEENEFDFYAPSKKSTGDHSMNKTVVL